MAMWHLQCALGSYMLHSIDLTIVVIPGRRLHLLRDGGDCICIARWSPMPV
eukprot:CAMPEP_0174299218 /NCGR_PEP_ID=MMETSP0809-20121228/56045_1 /TAXON_ID=73025 ORGANISM="Eutreptiella gymnastica-like, Strain CCMP1594" /NCGR_SAMPLE_ID=MMETSP0809 /ASSEMBLY_ACC=CAM_ASM_000658 /LENGTH=50 /DNA_ID=CAMNT_0015404235 /DNA_START=166 /DNA_END=315 /DNA_ORIENTATION=-